MIYYNTLKKERKEIFEEIDKFYETFISYILGLFEFHKNVHGKFKKICIRLVLFTMILDVIF